MRINLAIVISVLSFTATSCLPGHNNSGQNTTNFPVKPLIVFDNKDDGWGGDIRLSIVNINEGDSSTVYKVLSDYKGKKLGLLIYVPKAKESSDGFGKGIILKSIGTESDNLLHTLAELYKQHVDPNSKFTASVSVTYVDLSEFAKSMTGKTADDANSDTGEYKLFFENKGDEAELFLNINPTDKWVDLREKDEEYRPSVIKALKN